MTRLLRRGAAGIILAALLVACTPDPDPRDVEPTFEPGTCVVMHQDGTVTIIPPPC